MKRRMNGSIRKIAALVMGLVIAVCASVPAFAVQVIIPPPDYEPAAGDAQHGFKQYLIVDGSSQIPAIEFEYSIVPGQGIAAAAGRMEVLAGVGQPTVGKAVFAWSEDSFVQKPDEIELEDGQRYAVKTVNFDFSGVEFTEPGIYRYIVTMTSAGQQAVDYDVQKSAQATAKKRILDVYVIDEDGELKVDSYVFHELADEVPTGAAGGSAGVSSVHAKLADKSVGFVNYYATQDLEFGKWVSGNQASKDKYFEFTLKITNAAPNTTYYATVPYGFVVSGSTDATLPANRDKENPLEFTTDASGAATVKYYLCHDQYVLVYGLPRDCSYAVSENKEDYISTEGISSGLTGSESPHTDPVSGTIASADIRTGFTNTRNGIVPTGAMMAAAPAAGVFVLGGAGFAAVLALKRRKDGEDENA